MAGGAPTSAPGDESCRCAVPVAAWKAGCRTRTISTPQPATFTVVGSGRSDFRETEAAIRWPAAQPAFESRFAVLADLRELDYTPSFEDARGFAEVFKSQRPLLQGPVAVVVEGVVEIGIARMIAMLARFNGVRMQAFHDPARAQQWLREAAGFREIG